MEIKTDTEARIRQEAHVLFMQYGLKSVSLDDICKRMGISKKTVYRHFEDKEALVCKVVSAIIDSNQKECLIASQTSKDAIHEIFMAIEQMNLLLGRMNPSILFDMHKYYPKAYQIFLEHKYNFIQKIILNNFKRGIQEELYRTDFNIEIMASYRVESITIPFSPEFQQKISHSLAESAEEISLHFLYGIANRKGHKLIQKYIQNRKK